MNYLNDYYDGMRGIDTTARVGPVRLTASKLKPAPRVLAAGLTSIAVASAAGFVLAALTSWWLLAVGAAAIVASLAYSGGPKPYASAGLGELFVFVFFGLVATCGTTYVNDGSIPPRAWWSGASIGLIAVAILVVNNLRDIQTDTAAGKRTLAVRIGESATRALYVACTVLPFFLLGPVLASHRTAALAMLAFPLAMALQFRFVSARGPALVPVLVGTARLQLAFAVLLAIGLAIR